MFWKPEISLANIIALLFLLVTKVLVVSSNKLHLAYALPNPPDGSAGIHVVPASVVTSEVAQPVTHHMSCYVCSTMDYNDNVNNGCKKMRHPSLNPKFFIGADHGQHLTYSTSSSQELTTQTIDPSDNHTSLVTSTYQSVSDATMAQDNSQDGMSPIVRQRHKPAETPIKTRQCSPEEHYCSIVSVNKLDVKNNTMYTKFWALERNCSKSCNTGCLVIGEKIRLRVCSLCCRTPDCNFQNAGALHLAPPASTLLMLASFSLASLFSAASRRLFSVL